MVLELKENNNFDLVKIEYVDEKKLYIILMWSKNDCINWLL